MKYAVAYVNFFVNDLQLTRAEANDPITAMIEGARELISGSDDVDKWLDSMLENIPLPGNYGPRLEEIQEEFFNTDQLIAVMPI